MAGIGCGAAAQVLQAHGEGTLAPRGTQRLLERDQRDGQPAGTIAMQRVTSVNLNGNAYQVEEGAYDALVAYLNRARTLLDKNPDRAEIIADLEQAIADR